jgi:hypothetical protein
MAALFRSECAKHVIILDCINAIQNYNDDSMQSHVLPNLDQIEACYYRLTDWWQLRPSSLYLERTPSKENLLCAYVTVAELRYVSTDSS